MLNKIWPIFIIVSIIYAIFSGNLEQLNNSIFESTESTIQITLTLLGTMCLWSGLMKIASNLSLIDKFCKMLNPIINFLFPDLKKNEKIKKEISMNMTANILGLGNAATPLGLKAMSSMQKENNKKDTLSDSMLMFILINTASIQIILEELENKAQIVIGKEYCTVKLDNNILKIKYNDYFYADINKEDIINILSNLSIKFYIIMSVIVLIWIFILMTISTITDVLVIATMGYIISKIINKQFTFTNIFNIAIHAITLSVLLGGIYYIINSLTGFYMKYFSIMYTSIAIIYIMTSILLITSDNNENNNIQDD